MGGIFRMCSHTVLPGGGEQAGETPENANWPQQEYRLYGLLPRKRDGRS